MNSEDKPVNLSRCRDNSAQSSTCRPHLESHTSRSENSDTFLWWCLHVYKDDKKKWLKFLVRSKAINIGLLCSVIGWKTNSGCAHFFSALHWAALWAFLRNLIGVFYYQLASDWLKKRSRHFLPLMKNKPIIPSWLAHTHFPALFARCFCFTDW